MEGTMLEILDKLQKNKQHAQYFQIWFDDTEINFLLAKIKELEEEIKQYQAVMKGE